MRHGSVKPVGEADTVAAGVLVIGAEAGAEAAGATVTDACHGRVILKRVGDACRKRLEGSRVMSAVFTGPSCARNEFGAKPVCWLTTGAIPIPISRTAKDAIARIHSVFP